jgi:hypothetical protein
VGDPCRLDRHRANIVMASPPDASTLALRAIRLMAEWRRATAAHMALGGGMSCACGSAFDGISAADLEDDLVEYVREKHRGSPALPPVQHAPGGQQRGELARLLYFLAESPGPGTSDILDDLERAIRGLSQSSR